MQPLHKAFHACLPSRSWGGAQHDPMKGKEAGLHRRRGRGRGQQRILTAVYML